MYFKFDGFPEASLSFIKVSSTHALNSTVTAHKNKSFFIEYNIRIKNKDKRAKTIFGVFEFECKYKAINIK
jgi:hypothetical protein